ncbi:retrovirus-related pol polyprotein from transposon TNT 1-94 [Tanacetum coccineum]
MMMCKQAEQGVPLQAEQADWLEDTDEEIDEPGIWKQPLQLHGKDSGAPKCSTYNGRPTFANPRYLKKAQSEKPCLYEIPFDTSDPANRFAPDREETMTLITSRVNHTTSVSRPQLKCYQVKDKVMPNNSQVKFKKKEVEDHHRISSISKKTKSVTACNDSSKSKTLNVNAVCAECGKLNPREKANKSVATPHKKTVASDTTIQKSKSYHKELYENTNQEWKWWIAKRCPSGYKWTQKPLRTKKIWMPKIRKEDVSTSISPTIDIVSRITNHMTGNLKLLCNFVEKFLGTVRFGNDQFAPILGYGDLNQGNVTIKWVYYVEGLNHNLFSVGQFCDADLEVAFRKSTCFVRDLQGNDLLTGNRGSDLYTISLQETTSSTLICFMAKASPTQACKAKRSSFKSKAVPVQRDAEFASHGLVWSNAGCKHKWEEIYSGTEFLNKTLHAYFKEEGIEHQTSTPRTPEQNGVVERRNRTLVEAARTMLSASKLPLSFWAEAVATACYTQNRSIIISTHGKTGIHIINDRITFNKNIFHLCLTEIIEMMSDHTVDLAPQRQEMSVENVSSGLVPQGQKASDYDNSDPVPPRQNVVPTAEKTDSSQQGDYKKLVESSSASLHNTDVHFISTTKLATDPEMCMFALTVSIVEPKNIKEAMADSAWIEAMQDELHQFDRLQVWDIVDKPFGKLIIKAKVVMEETSRMTIRNCNSQQSRDLMGLLDPDHQKKSTSGKDFVWIKGKLQGAWRGEYVELSAKLCSSNG